MTVSKIPSNDADTRQCRLKVDGEMTIYTAGVLKDELLEPLEEDRHVELDLSAVDEFDTAGVQLLLLLRRELAQAQKTLHLSATSDAVQEVLGLYRLAETFNAAADSSSTINAGGQQ